MNSRRAFLVWGVAVLAYVLAVVQRSSLGVSGVDAQDRFAVSAAVLSTLAVVQIAVYAGLQIPVGIALDRVGPRRLVLLGAALLVAGQAVVAVSPTIGPAIAGRVLVGAGDAMTFISVIRLVPMWFSGPILPQISQWTGNLGQVGQILSAFPFAVLLHTAGWSPAFGVAAAASAVGLVLAFVFVRNGPVPVRTDTIPLPHTWRGAFHTFGHALRRPGTQLGFWSHYVTQSSGTVFSLLWGVPMLRGLGYSPSEAAGFLTVIVVTGFVVGPVLGVLCARFPLRRSNLVLGIVVALAVVWTAVLVWPGQPPTWLLVVLVVVMGIGGPGSLIGFDFARSFNPVGSLGSANGVVNVGGFLAAFVMMFLIGTILDLASSASGQTVFAWTNFRLALTVQYVVVGIGVVMLLHARRRTRRVLHAQDGIRVGPLWVALVARLRKRSVQ
ncbi:MULTISPECIES: nitrate/nitrite transporter [unclassified Curtobacterium]|uniref:MFS transporter n=1 Tax=unclassified Curtobacterium TaxID=257496 RepID=UPI00089DE1B5|nr:MULTISPECIES: MFS transporter [unclassified Curtobacterium]AOX67101.1 MFS transporter [Curtobacterium sp. BH-2-1-1]MCC8908752.1 MFS transporter [Curtobacterium sp. GD1]MCT9623253.1 MFS transporter [Curtobacterium sp. C2H10]MDR6171451.1 MFS family permease [Curtobacterium sp. SORGH_AS_0776]